MGRHRHRDLLGHGRPLRRHPVPLNTTRGAAKTATTHEAGRAPIAGKDTLEQHSKDPQNPLARRAGILCNDPRFQRFAAVRSGLPQGQFNATATAEYLRTCCNVASRRELDSSADAANRFHTVLTEFDAWRGRIASPR